MEWMNRGQGQGQPTGPAAGHSAAPAAQSARKQISGLRNLGPLAFVQVALLFSVTVLLIAVVWFIALGGGKSENSYVDDSKLQAVFLNGGQVYFGDINNLNSDYLSMSNIYYLRVNQQVQPNQSTSNANDVSLVKLGCELHGPQDNMVINREQVIFWENLKDDGQVAKAVAEYVKQNPDGQKCDATTTNSGAETSTETQNTTNTQNTQSNTNNDN
jgi:hypothetical protein